jgi:hypothetical protein
LKWVKCGSESALVTINTRGHFACIRTARINLSASGIISIKVIKFAT